MNSQGGQDEKHSMQILWVIFGIFFLCGAIWWGFSEQLKWLFIKVRWLELKIAYYFMHLLPFLSLKEELGTAADIAAVLKPNGLSMPMANSLSLSMGRFYMFPVIITLVAFAYLMYGRNIKMLYRKRYDTRSLMEQEKVVWPQIQAVSGLDLVSEDLDSGPWAMGQSPMQFCKQHKLLNVTVAKAKRGEFSKGLKFQAELNFSKANTVFAQQLGRNWMGIEKMPPHRRAIMAVLLSRACRDSKAASSLVAQMGNSSANMSEINIAGADDLWRKYYKERIIQDTLKVHAYEYTVFTSMLLLAREDGVLASADFLWLKPRDRKLWYVLNNVGRRTACVEAAGVHAHWLAEKSLGKALNVPMVHEATKALNLAIKEIIYQPDPKEKDELLQKAGIII